MDVVTEGSHSRQRLDAPAAIQSSEGPPAEPPRPGCELPRSRRRFGLLVLTLFSLASLGGASVLGDIVLDKKSSLNGVPAVVFPHWKHRGRFRCYACHPEPFVMKAGANDIGMAALQAGKFCGRCHNSEVAFEIGFNTCRKCHSRVEP